MICTSLSIPAGFARLAFPVPPQIEAAMGYDGEARYLAVYWEPSGNVLVLADGRVARVGTNLNLQAWLAMLNHNLGTSLLMRRFGDSQTPAEEWFVLDRANRQAFAASGMIVAPFLSRQWPAAAEPLLMNELEREHYALEIARRAACIRPPPDLIRQQIVAERQAIAEMVAWLDLTDVERQSVELERRAS